MDLSARLPDTHAGRHTLWLWRRLLAVAEGASPPGAVELGEHFAPGVFAQVSPGQISAYFAEHFPPLSQVTRWIEETSTEHQYSALLCLEDTWVRYVCLTQDEEPQLLVGVGCSAALNPDSYFDRRVCHQDRVVQLRDFGGTGPLLLLWHGAGADRTTWEPLIPYLTGYHILAPDLPGHGRSQLAEFTTQDALADADAAVAALGEGAPIILGHSLGGYLGLRYAATRRCAGWIGLDGPFGLTYPWDLEDPGLTEPALQIGREITVINVAGDLAALACPALLVLSAVAASPLEVPMGPSRRILADHIALHHPHIRTEWVQAGHDALVFLSTADTLRAIHSFLGLQC